MQAASRRAARRVQRAAKGRPARLPSSGLRGVWRQRITAQVLRSAGDPVAQTERGQPRAGGLHAKLSVRRSGDAAHPCVGGRPERAAIRAADARPDHARLLGVVDDVARLLLGRSHRLWRCGAAAGAPAAQLRRDSIRGPQPGPQAAHQQAGLVLATLLRARWDAQLHHQLVVCAVHCACAAPGLQTRAVPGIEV